MRRVLPHLTFVAALWLALGWATDSLAESAPLPTYTIVAEGGRLSPTRLEVSAGQRLKLILKNQGSGPIEFENLDMRIEKVLTGGATSFVVLPPLRPGTYVFVDEFPAATGRLELIAKQPSHGRREQDLFPGLPAALRPRSAPVLRRHGRRQ